MKNTIKTLSITAIAALTFTACGGDSDDSSPSFTSHPYDAPPISEALKHEYLTAINTARATGRSCGSFGYFPPAPPVVWNDSLYRASYEHSEDMATVNILSHTGSGTASDWTAQVMELGRGSEHHERARNNGYSGNHILENVALSSSIAASYTVNIWLASDPHCTAVMSSHAEEIGMARVGRYWTLLLGAE